jgi:bile acid:Na+ symporter, BASS family
MTLLALLFGKVFPQVADIRTGQLLVGSLPADISAPLMVYLAGGSTAMAMAMAMLVVAMALIPFVLPNVLTWFGGITFKIPVSYLIMENYNTRYLGHIIELFFKKGA